jgi:hypothetical protein
MAYIGGKDGSGVWQRLVNEIPPHQVFVSAFLGDCALMRRKRPARLNVGIDLDLEVLTRFSAAGPGWAADSGDRVLELQLYRCDAVEWLAHAFDLHRVSLQDRPSDSAASADAARFGDASSLRSTVATFGDLAGTVARFGVPAGEVLVYADPPYLLSTRRTGRAYYRHEMTEDDHRRLLECLTALPCLVMVSHYPCDLYAEALSNWRTFTFLAQTRRGPATEQVWCNYAQPTVLHDPRWLGRDKREREKLTRRRRNLLNKIRKLSAVERQSLLDSIGSR